MPDGMSKLMTDRMQNAISESMTDRMSEFLSDKNVRTFVR